MAKEFEDYAHECQQMEIGTKPIPISVVPAVTSSALNAASVFPSRRIEISDSHTDLNRSADIPIFRLWTRVCKILKSRPSEPHTDQWHRSPARDFARMSSSFAKATQAAPCISRQSTGRPRSQASGVRHGSGMLPTLGFPCSFVG